MTKVNGYLVTMTELKTMGLTPKGAIPADSNYIVSKGEISAAYYVDETAVPYSTYTSLRCPRYEDIVNTTTTTTTTACFGYNLTPVFDTTCTASGPDVTAYKNTGGSIIVGDILRNTCGGTTLLTGFYSDGSWRYVVNVGEVTAKIACAPPTTTTTTSTSTSTTTTTSTTTSTTSTTTSTTSTTTTAIPCAYYTVYNPSTVDTVILNWTDCAGFPGIGATVGPESYYSPTCARVGSLYGDGPIDITFVDGCS
jgi:hypothetical protein